MAKTSIGLGLGYSLGPGFGYRLGLGLGLRLGYRLGLGPGLIRVRVRVTAPCPNLGVVDGWEERKRLVQVSIHLEVVVVRDGVPGDSITEGCMIEL